METIKQAKGEAAPSVELEVTCYGNFGDRLYMAAVVDGLHPKSCSSAILAVAYRGRDVAWIGIPIVAADHRAEIESAILAQANYYFGSRCPDMVNYPLSFKWWLPLPGLQLRPLC